MTWTAFNYQMPGTKVWRDINQRKIISDTWDTQIYSQKARKSRRQGDIQEWGMNSSLSDKAQRT